MGYIVQADANVVSDTLEATVNYLQTLVKTYRTTASILEISLAEGSEESAYPATIYSVIADEVEEAVTFLLTARIFRIVNDEESDDSTD